MPRQKLVAESPLPSDAVLTGKLAEELKKSHECGQPLIYERELAPARLRVVVVWDEWERVPLEERTAVILRAYDLAEGPSYRNKIALASGLTVPEATASGMLPYQVTTAIRKGDPVNVDQCRQAMLAEGASTLFGSNILQLRFATQQEAEACRQRLVKRLPKSEDVWLINREVTVQDSFTLTDAAEVE